MTWESTLLWGALLAFLASLGLQLYAGATTGMWSRRARQAFDLGGGLLVVSLLVMLAYFLLPDPTTLRTEYVFTYTRKDYPWYYRMVGLWGGQKGTLLMWAAFTAVAAWLLDRKIARAQPRSAEPERVAELRRNLRIVLTGLLAVLSIVLLVAKTFEPTPEYLLQFRPDGNGLQPVLITPFMVIHPPLQFVAYALMGILFAGGLVAIATGDKLWAAALLPWTRLTWAITTLGLGLGGLWAYYVLNFGGFWAWDPVETANLLAWFPLTLLLHTLQHYDKGRFPTLAPTFAAIALPMALFATVATRTGLWVSVHAFTDPSKNFTRDPFQRLLFILETSDLLALLTAVFFASLVVVLAAVGLARVREWSEPRRTRARRLWLGGAAATLALLLIEPVASLSTGFEAAYWIGLRRSTLGGFLAMIGGVAAWIVLGARSPETPTRPKPAEKHDPVERALTSRNLFAAGVAWLSLAFLVTFLLDMMAVNGFSRGPFDERAPIVALPIFLTMGLLFLLPWLGAKRGLAVALLALALGSAAAFVFREHWEVALVLPGLVLAATGAVLRALRASSQGSSASARSRTLGALLMAGAFLGMVFWANPPSLIQGPGRSLELAWGWAFVGFPASLAALGCGIFLRGREDRRVAAAGALFLLPGFGYGLAALIGLGVLVAVGRFAPHAPGCWRFLGDRRKAFRKTLVYMIHFTIIVGLTGFALATYESRQTDTPLTVGQEPSALGAFGQYNFQVLSTEWSGADPIDGSPDEIHLQVRVLDGGAPLAETTLVFWHVKDASQWHYDARTTVLRLYSEDVYLFPNILVYEDGTELRDHSTGTYPPDLPVESLRLTVKVLPAVSLVWTGLFGLVSFMAAMMALGGFEIQWPGTSRAGESRAG